MVTESNIRFAVKNVTTSNVYSFKNHWEDPFTNVNYKHQVAIGEYAEYYYIDTLVVADYQQEITIADGVTDSIEAYCKRKINAGEDTYGAFAAFIKFASSAKTYLETEGAKVP